MANYRPCDKRIFASNLQESDLKVPKSPSIEPFPNPPRGEGIEPFPNPPQGEGIEPFPNPPQGEGMANPIRTRG